MQNAQCLTLLTQDSSTISNTQLQLERREWEMVIISLPRQTLEEQFFNSTDFRDQDTRCLELIKKVNDFDKKQLQLPLWQETT